MPPGWDGIETITRIWKEFPDIQIVICTAYSDYSWSEIAKIAGSQDQILILKKPFDNIEVIQIAHAMTKKWQLTMIARQKVTELNALVESRTAELHQANERLRIQLAEREQG
jgi:DNA-binding LytR/AlgR family response regulator